MAAEYSRNENVTYNIPQQFADKKIGACPFCGTAHPGWLVREEWRLMGSNA